MMRGVPAEVLVPKFTDLDSPVPPAAPYIASPPMGTAVPPLAAPIAAPFPSAPPMPVAAAPVPAPAPVPITPQAAALRGTILYGHADTLRLC